GQATPSLFRSVVRPRPAPAEDRRVGRLAFLAGLAALGEHAGRTARVPTARGPALATPHRVAHRVHGRAPVVRLAPQPPFPPRLAEADVHVLGVADGADGRPALRADAPDLAGGKSDLGPTA